MREERPLAEAERKRRLRATIRAMEAERQKKDTLNVLVGIALVLACVLLLVIIIWILSVTAWE